MPTTTPVTVPGPSHDVPRPAARSGPGLKDSFRAELIDIFELRMRRNLFSPGNPTLLRAFGGARRILAVCDRPEQGRRLATYLDHWRDRGALDHHRTVDGRTLTGLSGADPIRAVVRAAVTDRLGRRDAFLSIAGTESTATTALAAAMYRRYAHAVRVHDDLPALLASLHWDARTVAGDPAIAAAGRDPFVVVDVDRLLGDSGPVRPDEEWALRHLASFDDVLADQLDRGPDRLRPSVLRRAALGAVTRLLRRYGPGDHRVWQPPPTTAPEPEPVRTPASIPAPMRVSFPAPARASILTSVRAYQIREVSYQVTFASGVLDPDNPALSAYLPAGARVLAVVDDYSAEVTGATRRTLAARSRRGRLGGFTVLPVRSSPRGKTLDAAEELLRTAQRMRLGPDDRILAVGGGTVLDLVGYVAACHPGGTPYLRIPTTLVGLVDAGVGLKVGVDLDGRKNLLGAYHAPMACLCDPGFLATLPDAEFRCGLAEIVKIALVRDARLYTLVEEHHHALRTPDGAPVLDEVLRRAVAAMLVELEENPWERRLRRLADFGHEFGHVLEERSDYRLRHGEAVAIGMALSCRLGVSAGRLPLAVAERAETLLRRIGLPTYDDCCAADELWRALRTHVLPHKGGELHLAVPIGIGLGGFVDSIDEIGAADLHRAWAALRALATGTPPAPAGPEADSGSRSGSDSDSESDSRSGSAEWAVPAWTWDRGSP
ncbi:sedoheptulose 7-phosphate cyclase [Plantactinospora sp. S1510]|uniref:2-epi-5-epi-valiolone synthase n=1 Tax=Plantactinospora alkalitolerans TaxID=2789879 RepID=A0ABS0HAY7_9ACTN|nr:sedoheptulose 7-phosphate cyclase [Plantactinospora alkalitolerans]MBF9135451.1 sedoheptulose 7-phosphate cyclase [Plantactinospora alkalitolerans]